MKTENNNSLDKTALMLYWCEGLKAVEKISVTNSNVGIIKYFLRFLREEMNIPEERIYGLIEVHENEQLPIIAKGYWRSQTGIENWWKTRIRKKAKSGKSGKKKGKLPYGLLRITVIGSREEWKIIMKAIDELRIG